MIAARIMLIRFIWNAETTVEQRARGA